MKKMPSREGHSLPALRSREGAVRPPRRSPSRSEPETRASSGQPSPRSPAAREAPGPLGRKAPEVLRVARALAALEEKLRDLVGRLDDRLSAPLVPSPALVPSSIPAPQSPPVRPESAGEEMDETAKAFSRSVREIVDRRLEDLVAPLAALHARLDDAARSFSAGQPVPAAEAAEVLGRCVGDLAKVLEAVGGASILPVIGEPYDPLIHLAVGEVSAPDLEDGVVARVIGPGYRSGRGRVVAPARVVVARR